MACQIKTNLALQLSKKLNKNLSPVNFKMVRNLESNDFVMHLPITDSQTNQTIKDLSKNCLNECGINAIKFNEEQTETVAHILMNSDSFVKNVITSSISPKIVNNNPKKMIFEYSSPNIAKPFHVGHLRSTIIGNFLSNINSHSKNDVIRLNYLGDWGTQFGLLKVGVDMSDLTQNEIRADPMRCLYQAYVKANKLSKSDNSIAIKARQLFNQLENGEIKDLDDWKLYREFTLNELKNIYSRLGIEFDDYHWESSYNAKNIKHIIDDLEKKGVLKIHSDGQKVAIVNEKEVPIMKSDGSTLYLARDFAAAIDRFNKYNFDEMTYIVDGSQSNHFRSLISILDQAGSPIAPICKHVVFGRIIGMSTRKGTAVFLQDILDEAKDRMQVKQKNSPTTKVDPNNDETSDILGSTAVIINDLKQRRAKNYNFSWDNALYDRKGSGIHLQYVHCRLHSIEQNCGVQIPTECLPLLLQEPEALQLIQCMACFEDTIETAKREMESCILVTYLFYLCGAINKCVDKLKVKDQPKEIAEQRLLLFHSARMTLKRGLEVLGLKVLNQM